MANDPDHDSDAEKTALEHAWAWFSLHATQRLQSVNFFLIAVAFLSAAFVTAVKEQMYVLAGGIAILGACVSYFFYRMERRIRSLLHAAEDAMAPLQERLATALNMQALRMVSRVDYGQPGEWKYSKVFRYLYIITAAAFVLGLIYVLWVAVNTTPGATAFNFVIQAVLGVLFVFFGYEMMFGLPAISAPDRVQNATRWTLLVPQTAIEGTPGDSSA